MGAVWLRPATPASPGETSLAPKATGRGLSAALGLVGSALAITLIARRLRANGSAQKPPSGRVLEAAAADDEEPPEDPKVQKLLDAVDRVLDEWYVCGLKRAASKSFIKKRIANPDDKAVQRVRRWLILRINNNVWNHGIPNMCRTPENIPDLRSKQVWGREDFPWLAAVEAAYPDILAEILAARMTDGPSGFQPYRDPVSSDSVARKAKDGLGVEGVDSGAWNVLYLLLNHKRFQDNCARFPATIRAIEEAFPRHYSHAFFSALTPGSHIVKHTGPSNRMLRAWLPLTGLDGFRLRVGDTIVEPNAGEAFVWDHSYEHEAWHEGTETRVVLIVDVWHPDLTDPEVTFLRALQNCRLLAGQAMLEKCEERGPEDATYFDIVEKARSLLTDDEWWVIKAEKDPTTKPT